MPWCYTSDPQKRWEYCDIASCDGALEATGKRHCISASAVDVSRTSHFDMEKNKELM